MSPEFIKLSENQFATHERESTLMVELSPEPPRVFPPVLSRAFGEENIETEMINNALSRSSYGTAAPPVREATSTHLKVQQSQITDFRFGNGYLNGRESALVMKPQEPTNSSPHALYSLNALSTGVVGTPMPPLQPAPVVPPRPKPIIDKSARPRWLARTAVAYGTSIKNDGATPAFPGTKQATLLKDKRHQRHSASLVTGPANNQPQTVPIVKSSLKNNASVGNDLHSKVQSQPNVQSEVPVAVQTADTSNRAQLGGNSLAKYTASVDDVVRSQIHGEKLEGNIQRALQGVKYEGGRFESLASFPQMFAFSFFA